MQNQEEEQVYEKSDSREKEVDFYQLSVISIWCHSNPAKDLL